MGYESKAHEAEGRMGYRLRGYEGERNNCFSKIQLVGQKLSRLTIFRKLKLDINPILILFKFQACQPYTIGINRLCSATFQQLLAF